MWRLPPAHLRITGAPVETVYLGPDLSSRRLLRRRCSFGRRLSERRGILPCRGRLRETRHANSSGGRGIWRRFHFSNLRGEAGRPIVIAAADGNNRRFFATPTLGIHLSNPAFVELHDLVFTKLAHNGLNIDDGSATLRRRARITSHCVAFESVTSGQKEITTASSSRAFGTSRSSIARLSAGERRVVRRSTWSAATEV